MFATISNPYRPWPMVWGLGIVASVLGLVFCFPVFWPQILKLRPPFPDILAYRVSRLVQPPKVLTEASHGGRQKPPTSAKDPDKTAQGPTASAVPGTPQWRQHVERGRNLGFDIVAEQSLPILRAYGVPLALDVRRPRGKALLYDLQTHRLSYGVVADDAVVREVEGLPAEFAVPLREAERELGVRPRVWAPYSGELYSALRSLTEDALLQLAVPIDSVRTARVRLSLTGGRAFVVRLVSHS